MILLTRTKADGLPCTRYTVLTSFPNTLFIAACEYSTSRVKKGSPGRRSGIEKAEKECHRLFHFLSRYLASLGHFKRLYESRLLTRPSKQVQAFFQCLLSSYLRDLSGG